MITFARLRKVAGFFISTDLRRFPHAQSSLVDAQNAMDSVKKTGNNLPGPGPGRPKGSLNKTTQAAKDAIAQAAAELGGADRLVAWAKEDPSNERAFWTNIYPKLLPLQVNGAGENGEHLFRRIVREVVDPKGE
jgi:hypothetical protein